ncbi:hypothetical protein [Brachyspira aalborgi]|uniref:Lipoprotein n=1 Tax=Brachyspira aalborgi TaxID=29522 RepID=A0A5C8ERW2_9SPIR|nr:hypothetical protein [Brachyspira aalborgi]TXJ40546.1 hypothetical protein EPJ81_02495 [Brachyspira aalborgi]
MTKKILIIFLSFILTVGCKNKTVDPTQGNVGGEETGGGHLNNYGNGDLIENGKSDTNSIKEFLNKYQGVYYSSGKVTYKAKDGKLYKNDAWDFFEMPFEGITVEPNGVKMQISNFRSSGTIEVLNFADNGYSSFSSYILIKDTAVDTSMNKVTTISTLANWKGTFKELNNGAKFLSIDESGSIYFKEQVSANKVFMQNGDLVIVDNANNKNIVKFKEGNFVYRKYSRSDTDTTVYSASVSKDFIDNLGVVSYSLGSDKIQLNKFKHGNDTVETLHWGGIQIQSSIYEAVTKRAILKGKTITIFNTQGNKIERTITFNDDNSVATYTYKGKTTEFKRD